MDSHWASKSTATWSYTWKLPHYGLTCKQNLELLFLLPLKTQVDITLTSSWRNQGTSQLPCFVSPWQSEWAIGGHGAEADQ